MSSRIEHICVCICTFKRPELLIRLLKGLEKQITENTFTFSVVIVDNDKLRSAEKTVKEIEKSALFPITYLCEPEQNIAIARNMALENSDGQFIAFIDDDEYPVPRWLWYLHSACVEHGVDGALGPVLPHFGESAPKWIREGNVFERRAFRTGTMVHWDYMRSGNVMFGKHVFENPTHRFRREYGRSGGEDGDFFRRVCENGVRFVWSQDAAVYEAVTPERCLVSYHLRRAIRIGGLNGEFARRVLFAGAKRLPKNAALLLGSLLAMPVSLFLKKHIRVRVLVKFVYEAGWTMGLLGHVFFRMRDEGNTD